ncbi:Nodule Cysteine-Rich (NCR) secreted peptide [Medicago truncatula]|uniref:Nodule Cysteine-Rich (NCR) secreted peptide n=2 Tax=Medicago truncatula TaxID=3880 RepID=G7K947_MEDTR|nr:Nodule Cysteine-Rich (NCR) secreted peptide [Medicago truncatula]AFK35883.1 unknown [Medicago truncatula]
MVKTLKFVYDMILFIFLYLVAKNVAESIECRTVADCPKLISSKFVIKCIEKRCVAQFFD